MRILLAEDERSLSRAVTALLERNHYAVDVVYDGAEALDYLEGGNYDALILDIMMPKVDGLEVLRRLRRESAMPVIMLTARDTVVDKVSGLDMGADDYISKPFAIEELLARIRAALRKRTTAPEETLLTAGPLTMNVDKHQVTMKDQPVELTKKEFDLLRHLLENKGHVLSRETLLDSVWGFDFVGETNSVDVYIRFLRSKLDEAFGFKLIHTVRGVGYVIREN